MRTIATLFEQKAALRGRLRKQAQELSRQYLEDSDRKIGAAVLALPQWNAAGTVFLYLSVGSEPNTRPLIRAALQAGKRVAVPRCLPGGLMEARQIVSFDGLVPKSFGIPEPDDTFPLVSPTEIDLVVAPCVATDQNLHRLGNGGGYYDRYLPTVRCPVVCLCRGVFLLAQLPTDTLDAPVHAVVTERGVYAG